MKIIYFVLLLSFLHSCSLTRPEVTNVVIEETGSDSPDAFCKDFALTVKQVSDFLEKSREVEIGEFHDNYEYLSCYVKGSLNMSDKTCKFIIRAGGTAELSCKDQSGYLFVCDSCSDFLGGEK